MGLMVMKGLDNLVSGSLDATLRIWDTYTEKALHSLVGHTKVTRFLV
jgi:WD40 repeat protein